MTNAKHGHHHVSHVCRVCPFVDPAWEVSGGSGHGGKQEGVADGEHREMNINFGSVNGLASELRLHIFRADTYTELVLTFTQVSSGQLKLTLIVQLGTFGNVNTMNLTSNRFEQS